VAPVESSCRAELALHDALMREPRRAVAEAEIGALADPDARDNYRVLLRFRARLLEARSVEACYAGLFRGAGVDLPPLFVAQLAHVIVRNVLEGRGDPLEARAAELFFREQKATLREAHLLLADLETVEQHASGSRLGSLGRLIVEAQGPLASANLEVLGRDNAALYWARESRYDTVISLDWGGAALPALCRVIEAWIGHFFGIAARVEPLRAIEEPRWAWHIGLDAEASAILNELWSGGEVEQGRMQRIVALFRLDFAEPALMRRDVAGRAVYLALARGEDDVVRMKPQNLLLNLPLASLS
jgi:hypothetical protein